MITRRAMVAGGALALASSSPFLRAASAAEKPPLPPGLPRASTIPRRSRPCPARSR